MKIITYNVNGIRAAYNKNFVEWLSAVRPDVLCLQESKAAIEQIDTAKLEDLGYHHHWHCAQKKGYSGVGVVSKQKPKHVEYGCGLADFDNEGRIIRADFDDFSVLSVYVPSATNIDRLDFKMQFCHYLLDYVKELRTEFPNLIISGDFNIAHNEIDIHDPVRLSKVSGFLPMEREWLSKFLDEAGMVDSFRHFNDQPGHYSWWSYRAAARERNKGWRLDYNFVSDTLQHKMIRSVKLPDARHSDHCPVLTEFDFV